MHPGRNGTAAGPNISSSSNVFDLISRTASTLVGNRQGASRGKNPVDSNPIPIDPRTRLTGLDDTNEYIIGQDWRLRRLEPEQSDDA
jgi:hypothetical protein